ncbi:MAG: phenylalanine--tRNA ligase subunit beta, partial [Gemmataceae bacterium]|nr:phenylalanine--tRNA ligase subunit beta [Gemmataceae bacterium]
QLIERLTLAGLEVSGTRVLGLPIPEGVRVRPEDRGPVWDRDKIVIAEVLSVEKHPNADRLKLPTVTWGEGKTKQLVTGAPNLKVGDRGQKVVLALAGSVLFDGHSEERRLAELKPTKIRGVPSDAMVCSLLELGVSDRKEDHEGIIILEDDAPVGLPLADFMGDLVLEIDVLPNMARCLSMIGVAREVAALTGQALKYPATEAVAAGAPITGQVAVQIEDPKLSARYAAMLIRGVTVAPAPAWMQRRLLYAGMRPINNIVDITNYVMLEWGQPLHAFDWDVLVRRAGGTTPTITVRPARPGETLLTLDKQLRKLTPENLVIADTAGPIALAGVMGGLETEVTAATQNILLESANFDFVSIRRTMRQFDLPSEASLRFSKGIHPETVAPAAQRAAEFMRQCAGGTVAQGMVDCYPAPLPAQVIELPMSQIKRVLGMELPRDEAIRILRTLEFDVKPLNHEVLRVTAPPHRLDLQEGTTDLIEDLARIYGYDRLPTTLLADRLPPQQTNVALAFEERLRDLLVGCGLQEVITYSLTAPDKEIPLERPHPGLPVVPRAVHVELKNPISSERTVLRRTVLAGVLDVMAANLRHTHDIRLFEIGPVYLPEDGQTLPAEPRRLAIALTGCRQPEAWTDSSSGVPPAKAMLDFFDLKGILEAVATDLHLPSIRTQRSACPYLHPGKAATFLAAERVLGEFGQLHPQVAESYGLGGHQVLVAELDVEALQAALPRRFAYVPVPRFPAALRDIAVVVDEQMPAEQVAGEIRAAGGGLLRGLRLFDVYRGNSIPAGKKSLAYALSYQAEDRTLTDKEVEKAHKKIEDRLKHVLKALIRGKDI